MNISDYLGWGFAGSCALASWFFGRADGLLVTLLAFSCVDYCTGTLAAAFSGTLSSRVGFKGIIKKIIIFALVGIAHLIDKIFPGQSGMFREVVIFFYCANEGMSILENADKLGVPFPEQLKKIFAQMREKGEQKEENKKAA